MLKSTQIFESAEITQTQTELSADDRGHCDRRQNTEMFYHGCFTRVFCWYVGFHDTAWVTCIVLRSIRG